MNNFKLKSAQKPEVAANNNDVNKDEEIKLNGIF
jgi:hypothetical protein